MINRRHLILSTAALALGATIATPAAEVRTVHMVTLKTRWFRNDVPTYSQVPASTLPFRPYYFEQPIAELGTNLIMEEM